MFDGWPVGSTWTVRKNAAGSVASLNASFGGSPAGTSTFLPNGFSAGRRSTTIDGTSRILSALGAIGVGVGRVTSVGAGVGGPPGAAAAGGAGMAGGGAPGVGVGPGGI